MNFFYITSFITEKISKRIIEKEGIKEFEIISDERYEPYSDDYLEADEIYKIERPIKSKLIKNWKNILSGNKKMSEMSGEGFNIYIPHANAEFVRIVLSHPRCNGFSFIEEGFTSYCNFGKVNTPESGLKRKVKEYITYMGFVSENKIFKEGYSKAYCLSEYSFPGWKRKKVIRPKISGDNGNQRIEEDSCILVIDSMRTLSQKKQKVYISTLSKVLNILSKKYAKVIYKMHPDNYLFGNDEILKSVFEISKINTKEIGRKYSVERLAVGSSADVIVNLSSAGLYCLLFSDSNVYTFYDMFRRHAKMAGVEGENILGFERFVPDVFWDNALPLDGGE